MHPPPSPAGTDFTLITECTPESSGFNSVYSVVRSIPHWPLPAVRVLTRDGRLSTYDDSVLKLSKVSFRGKYVRMGHTLKLPSSTKLARLGRFPPASQAGRLAGPVFYTFIFSLVI